jgi:protein-L-isoaspartate(D-aspartate) O-methyltransferase
MRLTSTVQERRQMVRHDLAARGVSDRRVLAAMQSVPREQFVGSELIWEAYADRPLSIGAGQTISQPYIVALMTEAARLTRRSRVLEVGTGSGYHAAVLGRLALHVWTMERIPDLAASAAERLERLGIRNVTVLVADGALGFPAEAPYDAIVVAAAAADVPRPLLDQLAPGGRLVMPVGSRDRQRLVCVERTADGFSSSGLCGCVFVPLVSGLADTPAGA